MNKFSKSFVSSAQKKICDQYGSSFLPPNTDGKIGIAINNLGAMPITGVRKKLENGTEGWYIWSGDYSDKDDFFKAIHVSHIEAILPDAMKYLALEPGYKFIFDDQGYEDVWFDETLLNP
jgi:hypothetical protein